MLMSNGLPYDDYEYIANQETDWKETVYNVMLTLEINWYPSENEFKSAGYQVVADQIRNYASHTYLRHEMNLLTRAQYQNICITDPRKRNEICKKKTKWVRNSRLATIVLIGEEKRIMREALRRRHEFNLYRDAAEM